jgi:hypothetical protein
LFSGSPPDALICSATGVVLMILLHLPQIRVKRVEMGSDGLYIAGLYRREYVAFEDIESVVRKRAALRGLHSVVYVTIKRPTRWGLRVYYIPRWFNYYSWDLFFTFWNARIPEHPDVTELKSKLTASAEADMIARV